MPITRRQFAQFALGAPSFAAGSALASDRARAEFAGDAEKSLYEAAKKEGELTWYDSHHPAEVAELNGRRFSEKYPGVVVNVVRTTANVAFQRATQEMKAGGPLCDVLSSSDITHCLLLKTQGQLERFVPANVATMLEPLRKVDPEGFFHVTQIGTIGLAYNPTKVTAAEAPRTWTDLLDPKWKNQVSVGHPAFSGYVSIWCWEMQRLYGWDYFEKLKANNPQIGRSLLDTLTMLRSGERTVAHAAHAPATEAKNKGDPIETAYAEDGTVVIVSPSCILKGCKHPNAARLFMEFMTSAAASRISVETSNESLHEAVKTKAGKPLSELKTLIAPPGELQKGLADIKEKWRDTFGV